MRECGAAVRTLHIRRETKRNTQTNTGGRWRSASAGRGRSAVLPSSDSDRPGGAEAPIIFREIERHDSRAAPVGSKNAIPVAVGPSLSHSFRFRDEIEMEWSERASGGRGSGTPRRFIWHLSLTQKTIEQKFSARLLSFPRRRHQAIVPCRERPRRRLDSQNNRSIRGARAREQRDGGRQNMRRRDGCHFSLYY